MDKEERKNENENDSNDENNEEENNEKYHFIIGSGSENFESSCHHSNKKKWVTNIIYENFGKSKYKICVTNLKI